MYTKKITGILITFAALLHGNISFAQERAPRNYLYAAWRQGGAEKAFAEIDKWRAAQRILITAKMQQLPEATRAALIRDADKVMDFNWPSLPATVYLEFKVNGNRSHFEALQSERRKVLTALVADELADRHGKYLPQIANGLWAILEESTWVLPAHVGVQKAGTGLPDPAEPIVDLVAGETAAAVSWVQFLFRDELDKISPMLNRRVDTELEQRVITPFLQRNDFWWMGYGNRMVNNWNIWINTNVLQTALLSIKETDTRNKVIEKAIRSADNFVNAYPEDGGCDEGPTYWGHAGGKLVEFITWLNSASGHQLNLGSNELIHRIGAYIYKMHIDSSRFVNFADASAIAIPPPHTVYLYGEAFNDPLLRNFAAYLYRLTTKDSTKLNTSSVPFFIYDIETRAALLATRPAEPFTPVNWLPDLQVLSLRAQEGSAKGLFFAAQGGHNAESHNHNDVGNFVLYMNGRPAVIDVGVGTYTKQTFSADRYKLWYMQSQWHNCPDINGVQQQDGRKFHASDVQFNDGKNGRVLSMDIAAAYPEQAMVASWKRTFAFSPSRNSLTLEETYKLNAWKEPFRLHFMTALEVDNQTAGKIVLTDAGNKLVITYDPSLFEVATDHQQLDDKRLSSVWGNEVIRVSLVARKQALTGKHSIRFDMQGR
ncbi:MAG TPA: heparinase II/III family protein [Chitinophaga sp.]|uniref:heparinase II/III domain-containing protein n=1 Tax=Chitinophaga sp. TaxID=1869181 RepID=UPI002BAFB5AE|nr:heparinase II/III family protein [Chitinophaga sp.]HVI43254.1 heparinase II/III family protein [Chitinophaga sp.]